MKEGWRIRMFGLLSKGRVRQCQLYLEESHAEMHKWQWKYNQEGRQVFWHKHTLVGQTHAHDEGLVASGDIRTVAFTLSWGMGARKWQPRHKQAKRAQQTRHLHPVSRWAFVSHQLSGDNNELLCTKTNYIFWKSTL